MATTNAKNSNGEGILKANSLFWSPDYLEPSAWLEHIPFSFWLIENFKPDNIVELGVYNGTSYFSFCQAVERLNLNTRTYGVDSWKGDEHAGFYEEEVYKRVVAYNNNKYSKFSTLIRSTFDEARTYFSSASVNLLHIDGLHTYEAVKHDFEKWLPALSENAIVIFHDINVRERGFGVFRFWEEITKKYSHFEFDFGSGLGVLAIGKNYPPALELLFQKNKSSEYYTVLRNLFAERGSFFKKSLDFAFLQNEANDLRYKVAGYENRINELSAELSATSLTNRTTEDETERLTLQLQESQERNFQLSKLFHDLQTTNSALKEENNSISNVSSQQEKSINEVRVKIEKAEQEIRSNLELSSKLALSEEVISELRKELTAIAETLKKTEEENKANLEQNSKLTRLNKDLEKHIFVFKLKVQKHQETIDANINKISKLVVQAEELISGRNNLIEDRNLLLEKMRQMEADNSYLSKSIEANNSTIQNLNKEILLLAKPQKHMQSKNQGVVSPIFNKINSIGAKGLDRFPRLSFHIKKVLLLLKWTFQGTRSKYKYKIDFWKYHRYVPYALIDDYIAIQQSDLFDKDWYLATYVDVKNDKADPILHYMLNGYYEGRDAGPLFSTIRYINYYSDVRRDGVNPLLHFIYHGKREGRKNFIVLKETDNFPYPVSHVPTSTIIPHQPAIVQEPMHIEKNEPMLPTEPDFLKRRLPKKPKRNLTSIKTVAFIAQPEYFDFHYRDILESIYTVRYFPNSFSENPDFFKELVEFDADINVFFRGELLPVEVLNALSGIRVNLSSEPFPKIINQSLVYTEDSLNRFEFFLRIFDRPYDYIFHYDEVSKAFFENQGIELSGFFPFPLATEVIKPASVAKKWDIFFSGRSTTHRDQFFNPLKRDFNFLHINHGVVGPDLLDFVHQCKISLNIHAENEISWEPRTTFMLAAGSLMISEPLSRTCPLRPGIDFIEINDPWQAYETCRQVLANYEAYKHIAESGRKRVVDVLSSRKTFPVFFNDLMEGKYKAASFNSNRLKLQPLKMNLKYNGFQHLLTELLHEHA
jgi:hypothetical protein